MARLIGGMGSSVILFALGCGRLGYQPLPDPDEEETSESGVADASSADASSTNDGAPEAAADVPTADSATESGPSDAPVVSDAVASCPEPSATVDPTTGHCYFMTSASTDWYKTRDTCAAAGSHLVTIGSAIEQQFLWNWVSAPRGGLKNDVWIGLYQPTAGSYVWVNGEPLVFFRWAVGEPNDPPVSCGRMMVSENWADWGSPCLGPFLGICEREP